jgi:uncharacterized membrane protein YbhN (UPF0104 family)
VNQKIKTVIQYIIMLLLTSGLLWLSLRSLQVGEGENKAEFIWRAWEKSDKGYLLLVAVAVILSHVIRAERWRLVLIPTHNHISLGNSFLSVMVGYLINLVIPRGGEVSRCYNLYKLENTPVEVSFGTVVVERIVDVICLFVIIVASFIIEWDKLEGFIATLPFATDRGFPLWIVLGGVVLIGVGVTAFFILRKNEKVKKLFDGFKEGLLAVFRLEKKGLFIFYSVLIWLLYFFMTYFVVKAFPETSELGFSAVMTLFAIGAIAMAAPLPGGAGSYHTIVPLGLVMLYHLPKADAIAFVFIFHGWQTIIFIVFGLISLITSYLLIGWKNRQIK